MEEPGNACFLSSHSARSTHSHMSMPPPLSPLSTRDPLRLFKLCCAAVLDSLATTDAGEYVAATRLVLSVFDAVDADGTGAEEEAAAGDHDSTSHRLRVTESVEAMVVAGAAAASRLHDEDNDGGGGGGGGGAATPSAPGFDVQRLHASDVAHGLRLLLPIVIRRCVDPSKVIQSESVVAVSRMCRVHAAALQLVCVQLAAYVP